MSTFSATHMATGAPTMPSSLDPSAGALVLHPYSMMCLKSHVPMTLDLPNSNYNKWLSFFKAMCGKFGLLHHIDGFVPPCRNDPSWEQVDCCVRMWLYGSISESVLDFTMAED